MASGGRPTAQPSSTTTRPKKSPKDVSTAFNWLQVLEAPLNEGCHARASCFVKGGKFNLLRRHDATGGLKLL